MIWQLIETAPKDGTSILLCVAPFEPLVGRFDEALGWVDFGADEYDNDRRELWIDSGEKYAPTHWMPLPPPPAGSP